MYPNCIFNFLLQQLYSVLGMLVYTIYGYWPAGEFLCTLWMAMDFSNCEVSILHLLFVGNDRYVAIVHPIDYKVHRQFPVG